MEKRYLERLDSIDLASLSEANAIDCEVLRNQVESSIFQTEEIREFEWKPAGLQRGRIDLRADRPRLRAARRTIEERQGAAGRHSGGARRRESQFEGSAKGPHGNGDSPESRHDQPHSRPVGRVYRAGPGNFATSWRPRKSQPSPRWRNTASGWRRSSCRGQTGSFVSAKRNSGASSPTRCIRIYRWKKSFAVLRIDVTRPRPSCMKPPSRCTRSISQEPPSTTGRRLFERCWTVLG